jgi:hypothetical protein
MRYVKIKYADKKQRINCPVDNPHIIRACELEIELHNRDFPDDPWELEIEEPETEKPKSKSLTESA